MLKNATKMTGFVMAILITFIFAMATPVFTYAATDSTVYTEEPGTLPRADDDGNVIKLRKKQKEK